MTNDRSHTELRPEMAVLLACAHPVPPSESLPELLRAGLDWDLLLTLCQRHALLPLVQRELEGPLRPFVPPTAQAAFGRAARVALAQSTLLTAELGRVLQALATRGVRALAYKGPAMAVQLRGQSALRTFRDLDILVTRADFFAARRALAGIGYRPVESLRAAQEEALFHTECDQALVNETNGATVELHWAVAPPYLSFPLETERLLARSIIVDVDGFPASVPAAEDLLLLLAMNGAKDCWSSLEPVALVALLLQRHLDWSAVLARALALRAQRMLSLALSLAADLFDAPAPLTSVEPDPALAPLFEIARSRLLATEPPALDDRAVMHFRTQTREHRADRLRYYLMRSLLPTATDCQSLPLPRELWLAAALVRPFRLLAAARRGHKTAR